MKEKKRMHEDKNDEIRQLHDSIKELRKEAERVLRGHRGLSDAEVAELLTEWWR